MQRTQLLQGFGEADGRPGCRRDGRRARRLSGNPDGRVELLLQVLVVHVLLRHVAGRAVGHPGLTRPIEEQHGNVLRPSRGENPAARWA